MASARRAGRRVKPAGGYELMMWYLMRISGLLLVFLALGHLFITHILNNVEVINYAFVASRWGNPRTGWLWRLWDFTMIALAVFHGFNGLREVLYEYVTRPSRRVLVSTVVWGLMFVLLGIGGYAIVMFQQDEEYIRRWKSGRDPVPPSQAGAALGNDPAVTLRAAPARPARGQDPLR